MGIFASFSGEMSVPADKQTEFTARVMLILQQGGMFQTETVKMFDKEIVLLCGPQLDEEDSVWVDYNYGG